MPALSQEFLDIQITIECGLTLKCVHDMIRTYSQMHDTDEYSKHSSIICSVWLNGWVFVYELSGCGFESSCSHLNFRFCACFEQGVPWHSGNYRVWIHSEMHLWHDKYIQSNNNIGSDSHWIITKLVWSSWTLWLCNCYAHFVCQNKTWFYQASTLHF